jgi:hypothetical protein
VEGGEAGARLDARDESRIARERRADALGVAQHERGRQRDRELRRLVQEPARALDAAPHALRAEGVDGVRERSRPRLHGRLQGGPAPEAVLARDRELRGAQRDAIRDGVHAPERVGIAALGGALQVARAVPQLVEARVGRQRCHHDLPFTGSGRVRSQSRDRDDPHVRTARGGLRPARGPGVPSPAPGTILSPRDAQAPARKQPSTWSSTTPTACMNA